MIGRRCFVLGGLVGGVAAIHRVTATPVPADDDPLDWIGRVFENQDAATDPRHITVTVWRFGSEDVAARSMERIAREAREPHPMSRAAVVDVETFPLSSLPGSLASWAEVARSGAVRDAFAGGVFQQGALCWSMEALGEDRDAMFTLITRIAHDVLSRELPASLDSGPAFEGGLWELLPQAQDLPGMFEVRQFFRQGTIYNPEGTPYPPEEALRGHGSPPG